MPAKAPHKSHFLPVHSTTSLLKRKLQASNVLSAWPRLFRETSLWECIPAFSHLLKCWVSPGETSGLPLTDLYCRYVFWTEAILSYTWHFYMRATQSNFLFFLPFLQCVKHKSSIFPMSVIWVWVDNYITDWEQYLGHALSKSLESYANM